MFLSLEREAWFPNLKRDSYRVTSEESKRYNCMSHAAERDDIAWWPVEADGVDWPISSHEETIQCFMEAYATCGYELCEDSNRGLEPGFLKIALYVDEDGAPCHAARQLPNGQWSSKLGDWEDIEHDTLDALEDHRSLGLAYGTVSTILKRTVIGSS